jgi:predicted transcriptional regulator
MFIKEIMDIGAAECSEDTSLTDVYELMQTCSNGYVVVIDSRQHRVPIGIVDEHSICENVIKRSKSTKGLDAGGVINSNIKRIPENTEVSECESMLNKKVDAILVVDERRRFLGTVDPRRLESSIARLKAQRPAIVSGILGQHVRAAVEIPAFGWLK